MLGLWLGAGGKCTENLDLFIAGQQTCHNKQKIKRIAEKMGKKSGTINLLCEMFVALGEWFA